MISFKHQTLYDHFRRYSVFFLRILASLFSRRGILLSVASSLIILVFYLIYYAEIGDFVDILFVYALSQVLFLWGGGPLRRSTYIRSIRHNLLPLFVASLFLGLLMLGLFVSFLEFADQFDEPGNVREEPVGDLWDRFDTTLGVLLVTRHEYILHTPKLWLFTFVGVAWVIFFVAGAIIASRRPRLEVLIHLSAALFAASSILVLIALPVECVSILWGGTFNSGSALAIFVSALTLLWSLGPTLYLLTNRDFKKTVRSLLIAWFVRW